MKYISLICGFVSLCSAALSSPNVIVFVTDDMHWSAHMDEGPITNKASRRVTYPTPNFDRVRQEGATFTRGVTAGTMCAPARFSIMTGRYPSRSIYGQARASATETHLDVTVPNSKLSGEDLTANLPTALQAAGYTTGMTGKWHIAAGLSKRSAYDDGVDAVKSAGFDWAGGVYVGNVATQNKLTAETYSHNMEWMVEEANSFTNDAMDNDQPFFLYFATTAPHAPSVEEALAIDPRQTPSGYLSREPVTSMPSRDSVWQRAVATGTRKNLDSTAGAIWCDDALGALMQNVEDRGELDNTMVILLMDHGQEGKGKIDEGGARILYSARYPATVFAHTVVDSVVSTVDIAPTVLELAGVGGAPFFVDGRSWLNLAEFSISTTSEDEPRNVFVENDYDRAIYGSGDDDNMKLVNGAELYDVSMGDDTDLAGRPMYAEVLQRLSRAFECYEDATAIGTNAPVQCS